jgi:trk system potassium uptake protein TrkA
MKFTIIVLGNFGRVLAEELTALGHEVVGVDVEMAKVDAVKDKVTMAYRMDASDLMSLRRLPLTESDVVVVAIGENFGDSIKVVAMLKQMNIAHIYARAIDSIHAGVLQAFAIDRVLNPEELSARMLVHSLDSGIGLETFVVDAEHYVEKFQVPESLVGRRANELRLFEEFSLQLLCVSRGNSSINLLGMRVSNETVVENQDLNFELTTEDKLVCFGKYKDFKRFWKSV